MDNMLECGCGRSVENTGKQEQTHLRTGHENNELKGKTWEIQAELWFPQCTVKYTIYNLIWIAHQNLQISKI